MGYASVSFEYMIPKPLLLMLYLLDCVHYLLSLVFYYTGLSTSDEAPRVLSWQELRAYMHSDASTALPKSDDPSALKEKLPVVELGIFVKRNGESSTKGGAVCLVCLEELKEKDEVRELGNCRHVFHVACVDRWIDVGRLTCPLCRLQLMPQKRKTPEIAKQRLPALQKLW